MVFSVFKRDGIKCKIRKLRYKRSTYKKHTLFWVSQRCPKVLDDLPKHLASYTYSTPIVRTNDCLEILLQTFGQFLKQKNIIDNLLNKTKITEKAYYNFDEFELFHITHVWCQTLTEGSVVGLCLSTGWPSLSTMNLVKFHLTKLQRRRKIYIQYCISVNITNILNKKYKLKKNKNMLIEINLRKLNKNNNNRNWN